MPASIASVFADLTKDTTIDKSLLHRIHQYERSFVNRSKDHVEFFGGNLMGVNPIRFRTVDRDDWFSDVLRVDELELRDAIVSLPTVNADWKRASDVMNLSCIWLLHAIHGSALTNAEKEEGMVDTLLILQYKFLTSLMAHYYPYPADRSVMEAAYASLSKRYALKVAGSWNVLLHERAKEVISASGIHRKVYQQFNNDKAIGDMISDIQGRLKKIIKSLTAVFYDTRAAGGKIGIEKSFTMKDGEVVLSDKSRNFSTYLRYIHQVMDDPRSFIRKELIDIVADLQHTMPPRQLEEALEWLAINHHQVMSHWTPKVKGAYVESFVDEVLLHCFSMISNKTALITSRSGIGPLMAQLRTLYMASRMADPSLLKAKEMADNLVNASISSRNVSVAASVRTGLQLYIVLRTLAMSHYTN